jgi:hypothetical protein
MVFPPLPHLNAEFPMTEERKHAILFAATLLCARKLMDMESDKRSPTKVYLVERAISQAAFIMERIDAKWPKTE